MSPAPEPPETGAAVFRAARAQLATAGVDDPARDARLLLAHAMGIAPDRVMLALHDPLPPGTAQRLTPLVEARTRRQPMAQITGRRSFWGRDFRVTPDVLDPRPETEILIATALQAPFSHLLDLGTGSGAIALTLLAERTGARALATDLSPAALAVARENAHTIGVQARAEFAQGAWFDAVPPGARFDLIVSNPPYIAADEMPGLAPEVRDWEPHMALTPGGDGLDPYRAIAAGALARLVPGGRLMVEAGPAQGPAVAALFTAAGLVGVAILPDFDGRDRVIVAKHPGSDAE